MICLRKKQTPIHRLTSDDGSVVCNREAAERFNTHFTSIATELVQSLPPPDGQRTMLTAPVPSSCFVVPTDAAEVYSIMYSFGTKKCHKNEIQPRILLSISNTVAHLLSDIYNRCMSKGQYPKILKMARVIPIFKSGDTSTLSNYRPISTLSIFNKIFEKILHARLNNFFDLNNTLSDAQYGFRPKRSTTLATLTLFCDLLKACHDKTYVICLFLDLRKAFDVLDPVILLSILNHYGIRGNVNALLKSYLTGREQFVVCENAKSSVLPISLGVPQGSVLGPLLFNIFLNDISNLPGVKTVLFADDSVFYSEGLTFEDAVNKMTNFINVLQKWLVSHRLVPHEGKTKLMLVTSRPRPELPVLFFNGKVLEWVRTFKYLGTIIDDNLLFTNHVNEVCGKLSRARGIIYASSRVLPTDGLLKLYHSLVYPYFSQSVILWGGSTDNVLRPVKVALNKILRTILNVRYDENHRPLMNTTAMYERLRLLQFNQIYEYFLLKFIRYAIYEDTRLFNKLFAHLLPNHQYGTRHNRFNLPAVRLDVEKQFVIFQSVQAFNRAHNSLIGPMSSYTFKCRFKKIQFPDN